MNKVNTTSGPESAGNYFSKIVPTCDGKDTIEETATVGTGLHFSSRSEPLLLPGDDSVGSRDHRLTSSSTPIRHFGIADKFTTFAPHQFPPFFFSSSHILTLSPSENRRAKQNVSAGIWVLKPPLQISMATSIPTSPS